MTRTLVCLVAWPCHYTNVMIKALPSEPLSEDLD